MLKKNEIKNCLVFNTFIIIFFIYSILYNLDKTNIKIGYNDDLIIIGTKIDNIYKYIFLQFNIFLIEFVYEFTYEYANPKLYFLVFDDDKKLITEFSKIELQLYSQILWFLTSLKNGLMLLISVSQIDLVISKILYNQLAHIIVIKKTLDKKSFIKRN